MSRDPYRNSTGALPRDPDERWERESYTRSRGRPGPDYRDDPYAHGALPVRGSPVTRAPPPVRMPYPDERSEVRSDIGPSRVPPPPPLSRDPRDRDPRDSRIPPPPPSSGRDDYSDHYLEHYHERERGRDLRYPPPPRNYSPSPPPVGREPRPGMVRRQSSLDTFDRIPTRAFDRDDYGAYPPRRDEYPRPGPQVPYIPEPLPPRSHRMAPPAEPVTPPRRDYWERAAYEDAAYNRGALEPYRGPVPMSAPPVRRYFHDDIHVAEAGAYGDEEWRPVEEREVVHERRRHRHRGRSRTRSRSRSTRARSHSRDSRTTTTQSHTTTSRSSSTSSRTSTTSSGTTTTVRNQYPKKGKTRIPSRLISKRALYDLEYPFEEDGNTTVVLMALGPQNIDDLLKLSDDYKKAEAEVEAASEPVEEPKAIEAPPPPPPAPVPAEAVTTTTTTQTTVVAPAAAPVVVETVPPPPPAPATVVVAEPNPNTIEVVPPGPVVEVIENKSHYHEYERDVSPSRSYTTDYTYSTASTNPVDRLLESDHVHVGPLVLAKEHRHKHKSRSKSRSRSRSRSKLRGGDVISRRIRELEAERDGRYRRHRSHSLHGPDVRRAHEFLENGDLVVYEETREEFSDDESSHRHSRHRSHSRYSGSRHKSRHRSKSRGPRIEKDKQGPNPRLIRAMLATLT